MTQQSTPKTAAFRSLLQKATTLHAEILTLDAAIRTRDEIKAHMGECGDEAESFHCNLSTRGIGVLSGSSIRVSDSRITDSR